MATFIIVKYIVWGVAWALSLWVKKMNATEIIKTENTQEGQLAERMTAQTKCICKFRERQ
ncbi:hypothetical protein BV494_25630 (plasmid) [Rahnella sikkimica]|uniref:Uncharacterized protein n=1 Tax=Rahnella sikkimica TaxID=1805933 RepID=A0A2L1UZA4_9GAMM|nr:hypothetical protein BV494_25630 [Rahnella sikkimica]